MSSEAFKTQKEIGLQAEDFVISVFEARGYRIVQRAAEYFPDFDFAVENRQGDIKTVEVKYDVKAHRTGNFYLDLPALTHSKADILVICYGQPIKALYFLNLPDAREKALAWPKKVRAGEFKEESCLIPKRLFLESFKPEIVEV